MFCEEVRIEMRDEFGDLYTELTIPLSSDIMSI